MVHYRYHAKGNTFKEIRMKNATLSKGGALAQTLNLLKKGEPINLGSVAFLKTLKNQELKTRLVKKLYYSELEQSRNLERFFQECLGLRKSKKKNDVSGLIPTYVRTNPLKPRKASHKMLSYKKNRPQEDDFSVLKIFDKNKILSKI